MCKELKQGPCNRNVVNKERVMLYKFGEIGTAQVMKDLMDCGNDFHIKPMCSRSLLKLECMGVCVC